MVFLATLTWAESERPSRETAEGAISAEGAREDNSSLRASCSPEVLLGVMLRDRVGKRGDMHRKDRSSGKVSVVSVQLESRV